jgi:hypothetical protein
LAPRKGFNGSKSENSKAKKDDFNPKKNTVGSELERKLRKYIVTQRYTSPPQGKRCTPREYFEPSSQAT